MSNDQRDSVDVNQAISEIQKIPDVADMQFTDVVMQVYPLRARMQQLEAFCAEYLNLGEDPRKVKGRPFFTPAAPWVMMIVCNYGKMSTSNFGWFSQHELGFAVPVRSYIVDEHGRPVFQDWGLAYPFVYVDNPLSMQGGRQVYGWTKAGILINSVDPNLEPNAPHCIVSISLPPEHLNASQANPEIQPKPERFLEIYQERPFLSGRSGVESALMGIPRAIAGSVSAAFGMLDTIGSLGSGYLGRDILSLQDLIPRLFNYTGSVMRTLFGGRAPSRSDSGQADGSLGSAGMITLKQFRDAEVPKEACFQAVVRSRMTINRMADGGLLFDALSGDPTGGIEIHLLRGQIQPIIGDLGIESSEQTTLDGQPADILRPVMPFWSKIDLTYGAIDYQYWRAIWRSLDGEGRPTEWSSRSPVREPEASSTSNQPAAPDSAGAQTIDKPATQADILAEMKRRAAEAGQPANAANRDSSIDYCSKGSGSGLELDGLFRYTDATIRVFPLLADTKKLQATMADYLTNPDFGFKVLQNPDKDGTSYVCVFIMNFRSMDLLDDKGNVKGTFNGDRMVRFVVPGELTDKLADPAEGNGDPAAVPFLSFAGEYWNYITEWEVYGRMVYKSILQSPDSTWMLCPPTSDKRAHQSGEAPPNTFSKPSLTQGLLNIRTFLIPEFNENKPAQQLSAIRIDSQGIPTATVEDSKGLEEALTATGLSTFRKGLWYISMKQVRDAKLINEADYKSLVGVFTKHDISVDQWGRLSDARLHIYNHPGLPIVELLGLENGTLSNDGDYMCFEPVKPFYFGGTMTENSKGNLTTMIEGKWRRNPWLTTSFAK